MEGWAEVVSVPRQQATRRRIRRRLLFKGMGQDREFSSVRQHDMSFVIKRAGASSPFWLTADLTDGIPKTYTLRIFMFSTYP